MIDNALAIHRPVQGLAHGEIVGRCFAHVDEEAQRRSRSCRLDEGVAARGCQACIVGLGQIIDQQRRA